MARWGGTTLTRALAGWSPQQPTGSGTGFSYTQPTVTNSFSYTAPAPTPPPSFNLSTSTYGNTIPVSAGERRLPGAYIWAKVDQNFTQQRELNPDGTERLSEETFLFNPFADIAVSFGYNGEPDAPTELTRVYLDGVEARLSSLDYTFYPGSETQEPDPTIRADKGAANTPAFRGQTYMVIRNLDLSRFGNRFPAVSAVINSESIETGEEVFSGGRVEWENAVAVDWDGGRLFSIQTESSPRNQLRTHSLVTGEEISTQTLSGPFVSFVSPVFPRVRSMSYVPELNAILSIGTAFAESAFFKSPFFILIDPQAGSVIAQSDTPLQDGGVKQVSAIRLQGASDQFWYFATAWSAPGTNASYPVFEMYYYDQGAGTIKHAYKSDPGVDGLFEIGSSIISGPTRGLQAPGYAEFYLMGRISSGTLRLVRVVITESGDGPDQPEVTFEVVATFSSTSAPGIAYDIRRDRVLVSLASSNAGFGSSTLYAVDRAGTIAWTATRNDPGNAYRMGLLDDAIHPDSVLGDIIFFADWNQFDERRIHIVDLNTGQETADSPFDLPEDWHIKENRLYRLEVQNTQRAEAVFIQQSPNEATGQRLDDATPALITIGGPASSQIGSTLSGSLIGRATTLAEIDESDITTINLDEPIQGWMVWENGEYRQHLANDGMVFGFDWFESGEGITLKRHVDGTNFTVDRVLTNDDLLLIEDSDAQVARVDEQEIAAIARVSYIDPSVEFRVSQQRARRARFPIPAVNSNRTAEYTTSVIMDARTALSNATKALFREDVGRVVLTFHLAPRRIDIETGDVVQLPPIAGKVWTVRIVETILREDFVTECSAQVLLENEAIDLEGFSGEAFIYTNGPPRLMRSPFVPSQAEAFPSEITEASS